MGGASGTVLDARAARWAYGAALGAAFWMPISLPAGRALLGVSLLCCLVAWVAGRRWPRLPGVFWVAMAWVALAVVVTLTSPYLEPGRSKLGKLAWWLGLAAVAEVASSNGRILALCKALVLGCGVTALRNLIENPWRALGLVEEGRFAAFSDALVHLGSMTDSQRMMVGLLLTVGLVMQARAAGERWPRGWMGLLLLLVAALVMHFKRGAWICTLAGAGCMLLIRGGWKAWALAVFLLAGVLCLPATRDRIMDLEREFEPSGGRMTMWREIAPALVKQHPWGIGYRTLTNAMMKAIAPKVEPNRDHLHSNLAEMLVSTGWLGLGLYFLWMGRALVDAGRYYRGNRAEEQGALALALGVALGALCLNGLIEYNLGDAEIVLLYVLLMGAAAAGARGLRSAVVDVSRD